MVPKWPLMGRRVYSRLGAVRVYGPMSVEPWKQFVRAYKAVKGPTPCPTVEVSQDWLVQWADSYLGPACALFDYKGDASKFLNFMAPPEVVNLAEFLPGLLERLQGDSQHYFVQIAWMWHWLQLYLNETCEGEPAGRPVLADGVAELLGSEQTRVPVNVWDALDEHLTLTLESPTWRKSDLLRMHECLTARGLVPDPERCHPEANVAHVPAVGRFYWAYQWPEQALWLELELVDPPT